jgi:hypothetical protein
VTAIAHECGHSLRGADHTEAGGVYDPWNVPPQPLLPKWHLMVDGGLNNDFTMAPPKVSKHWYIKDAKIVNEGDGNIYSKKIP